jgi:hypothetical protein
VSNEKHLHERTCIGCRNPFEKDQVVRIAAGPDMIVLDYREKLPGRGCYVCPRRECIEKGVNRENLSRALRSRVRVPAAEEFISELTRNILEKIKSLIAMSVKSGKIAAGYSAVEDALNKKRVELLVYARDVSEGTREKIARAVSETNTPEATLFTRDELGSMMSRELVGVIAFEDKGIADAVRKEIARLKGLINLNE